MRSCRIQGFIVVLCVKVIVEEFIVTQRIQVFGVQLYNQERIISVQVFFINEMILNYFFLFGTVFKKESLDKEIFVDFYEKEFDIG